MSPDDDAALVWQAHPVAEAPPAKSAALVAVVLGLSAAVWTSFESPGYGFLCLAILAGSMSRYFAPTRYRMDGGGVETSHLGVRRRVRWQEVRRVCLAADGMLLSPFARPSRLEAFRATFVRFGDNGEAVKRYVRERCHVASDEGLADARLRGDTAGGCHHGG